MTCSRDGVADCGMAGRVQNAARQARSHLGGVPSCRSTHRARSAAASASSSRQTKGGASRSQDARTAGLERTEEQPCTSCTLPCTTLVKIPARPHILCMISMYPPASSACSYDPRVPSTRRALVLVKPQESGSSNSGSPDSQPGLTASPSKVSPCSDHQLAVSSCLVSSAW